ncbi:TldD/PmbA family protein [candidate division WWE3 bacterium]|uniref:TldD/PmbA family protein n=1 Tax=candidate division WWE3 bacterium TaxID=2053526 RepID=A0A955LI29_UNCKA|nr:TldD/PmbA family protein [candidate division WWE3 bacterium]
MISTDELQKTVNEGLKEIHQNADVIEAVVYASANRRTVGRLVYTTHIPSNGLEEPKSDDDFGVSVEVWFKQGDKKLVGIGQEPNEISVAAVQRAYEKARRDAVEDPDFYGFLSKDDLATSEFALPAGYHDASLIDLSVEEEAQLLSDISWETISGAAEEISAYAKERNLSPTEVAFILNGDNFIIRERMALATTNGFAEVDESTIVLSFLTAMVESKNAKGSAWGARQHLKDLSAKEIGKEVAQAAIKNIGGMRVPTGAYDVVFGPQAVAELFGSLLLPHLTLGLIDFGASFFSGRFGQTVASEKLTIYDDPTQPNTAGAKRVTDEGAPTRKTALITNGQLVGLLADSRLTKKMHHKAEEASQHLGSNPHDIRDAIAPHSGFRFALGGGRVAGAGVGTNATNLYIEGDTNLADEDVIAQVKDGIYVGRLWYTYPVGGYASGIISGTVIADSYRIRDGKLAEPIVPNSLRIQDNLLTMLQNIMAVSGVSKPTILWASDEITHAPIINIKDVHFFEINRG